MSHPLSLSYCWAQDIPSSPVAFVAFFMTSQRAEQSDVYLQRFTSKVNVFDWCSDDDTFGH